MDTRTNASVLYELVGDELRRKSSLSRNGKNYVEYSLRVMLSTHGGGLISAVTSNDVWEFEWIDEVHYLRADVECMIGCRKVSFCLRPRYVGTEEEWEKLMLGVKCDDLIIRFSLGEESLEPLWVEAVVSGERVVLTGKRLDWAMLEEREIRRIYRVEGVCVDPVSFDAGSLLEDAYEGDWDDWACRNS